MPAILKRILSFFPYKVKCEIYQFITILYFFIFNAFCKSNKAQKYRVILVDFRYSGNIRAFVEFCERNKLPVEFGMMFVDPSTNKTIKNVKILNRFSPKDMMWAYNSSAFFTTILLRRFLTLLRKSAPHIKVSQLFHTLNLLGEPLSWFHNMSRYDHIFCSSPDIAAMFRKHNKGKSNILITGYGQLDEISSDCYSKEKILKYLDLPKDKKIFFIAPTLTTAISEIGSLSLNLYDKEVLKKMNDWAFGEDVIFLFRNHPHETLDADYFKEYENIYFRDSLKYGKLVDQMKLSDAMVTDLSGIGGYYIGLQKPLVFCKLKLNVENNIFFLQGEDLPGCQIASVPMLLNSFDDIVSGKYMEKYELLMSKAHKKLFGMTLDGLSCKRYYDALEKHTLL